MNTKKSYLHYDCHIYVAGFNFTETQNIRQTGTDTKKDKITRSHLIVTCYKGKHELCWLEWLIPGAVITPPLLKHWLRPPAASGSSAEG